MFDGKALAVLDAVTVPFSVNALVKRLGMSKPTVVSKIRQMEKLGLVTVSEKRLGHRAGKPFKIIKTTKQGNEVIKLARKLHLNELKASFGDEITFGIPESLAHYGVDMIIDRPSVVVPMKPKRKLSLIRSYVYDDKEFYEKSTPTDGGLRVPTVEDLVVCMLKTRFERLKVIPSLMARNIKSLNFSYLSSKAKSQGVLASIKDFLSATASLDPAVHQAMMSSVSMRSWVKPNKLLHRRPDGLPSFDEIRETYSMYVSA